MQSSSTPGSNSRIVLAIVLSISLLTTGCKTDWISIALADLPVLTQMALNIGTIATTLQSGRQISSADAAAIENISAQACRDLNLLQSLYNEYKSNPAASTLQTIRNVIADLQHNLPTLLQAAHFGNAALSLRIGAAVDLILATVASIAALIPQSSMRPAAQTVEHATTAIPRARDLKRQWNQQICTRDSDLDFSSVGCTVR